LRRSILAKEDDHGSTPHDHLCATSTYPQKPPTKSCAGRMAEHLGHAESAEQVLSAIARVLAKTTIRTPDLGGTATTTQGVPGQRFPHASTPGHRPHPRPPRCQRQLLLLAEPPRDDPPSLAGRQGLRRAVSATPHAMDTDRATGNVDAEKRLLTTAAAHLPVRRPRRTEQRRLGQVRSGRAGSARSRTRSARTPAAGTARSPAIAVPRTGRPGST
jgi:hypothetical protein